MLSAYLRHYRIPICRFAPVAYRACCENGAARGIQPMLGYNESKLGADGSGATLSSSRDKTIRDRCHQATCFEVAAAVPVRAAASAGPGEHIGRVASGKCETRPKSAVARRGSGIEVERAESV